MTLRDESTAAQTCATAGRPAATPGVRATNAARPGWSAGIRARLVRSPDGPRASARASATSCAHVADSADEKPMLFPPPRPAREQVECPLHGFDRLALLVGRDHVRRDPDPVDRRPARGDQPGDRQPY